jgi:hypothetical protein
MRDDVHRRRQQAGKQRRACDGITRLRPGVAEQLQCGSGQQADDRALPQEVQQGASQNRNQRLHQFCHRQISHRRSP